MNGRWSLPQISHPLVLTCISGTILGRTQCGVRRVAVGLHRGLGHVAVVLSYCQHQKLFAHSEGFVKIPGISVTLELWQGG